MVKLSRTHDKVTACPELHLRTYYNHSLPVTQYERSLFCPSNTHIILHTEGKDNSQISDTPKQKSRTYRPSYLHPHDITKNFFPLIISTLRVVKDADFSVAVLASNFRPLVSMHSFLPNFFSCSPTTSPNLFLLLCLQVLAFLKKVLL